MVYYCVHCTYKSKISWILLSHMNQNHADLEKKYERKAIIMSDEVDKKNQSKLKGECTTVFELCKHLQKMRIYDNWIYEVEGLLD